MNNICFNKNNIYVRCCKTKKAKSRLEKIFFVSLILLSHNVFAISAENKEVLVEKNIHKNVYIDWENPISSKDKGLENKSAPYVQQKFKSVPERTVIVSVLSDNSAAERLASFNKRESVNYKQESLTNTSQAGMQGINKDLLARRISSRYQLSTSQANSILNTVERESHHHGLDPHLILAIIATESRFNASARSKAGALGLMQAIPRWHPDSLSRTNVKASELYDPHKNIKVGVDIFSKYLKLAGGNITMALQRYNGSLNDRSRSYSRRVLNHLNWIKNH